MCGNYRDLRLPAPLVRLIVDDWAEYRRTLERLRDLHIARPELTLIPAHCGEAYLKHVPDAASDAQLGGVPLNRTTGA